MAQQSFNYLTKAIKAAYKGKGVADEPLEYLKHIDDLVSRKCQVKSPEDWTLQMVDEALKVNVSQKVVNILKHMKASKKLNNGKGLTKIDFINSVYALDVVKLSTTHIQYVTFYLFKKKI